MHVRNVSLHSNLSMFSFKLIMFYCQSTAHQVVLQYRYEDDDDDLWVFIYHVLLPHLSGLNTCSDTTSVLQINCFFLLKCM